MNIFILSTQPPKGDQSWNDIALEPKCVRYANGYKCTIWDMQNLVMLPGVNQTVHTTLVMQKRVITNWAKLQIASMNMKCTFSDLLQRSHRNSRWGNGCLTCCPSAGVPKRVWTQLATNNRNIHNLTSINIHDFMHKLCHSISQIIVMNQSQIERPNNSSASNDLCMEIRVLQNWKTSQPETIQLQRSWSLAKLMHRN